MYEDFVDKKAIEDYENRDKKKKVKFISSEEILKELV